MVAWQSGGVLSKSEPDLAARGGERGKWKDNNRQRQGKGGGKASEGFLEWFTDEKRAGKSINEPIGRRGVAHK